MIWVKPANTRNRRFRTRLLAGPRIYRSALWSQGLPDTPSGPWRKTRSRVERHKMMSTAAMATGAARAHPVVGAPAEPAMESAPARTRTWDPLLRRQMLYPAELRARERPPNNLGDRRIGRNAAAIFGHARPRHPQGGPGLPDDRPSRPRHLRPRRRPASALRRDERRHGPPGAGRTGASDPAPVAGITPRAETRFSVPRRSAPPPADGLPVRAVPLPSAPAA
jgi:hypothetical protein